MSSMHANRLYPALIAVAIAGAACAPGAEQAPGGSPPTAHIDWQVQPHFPGTDVQRAGPPGGIECTPNARWTKYGYGPIPCTDDAGNPGCRATFQLKNPLTFPGTACLTQCQPHVVASCRTPCGSEGTETCSADGTWGSCTAYETCDGIDNDCNGQTDEGGVCQVPLSAWRPGHPSGWDTWLDACGSTPLTDLRQFHWQLDLSSSGADLNETTCRATSDDCTWVDEKCACDIRASTCKTRFTFPAKGSYNANLEVSNESGGRSGRSPGTISIQHYVIASMGDSIASGEGVPETALSLNNPTPLWRDRRCHRSFLGGHAQAARSLESADDHSSVTFVSVACSGASITRGLLQPYDGQEKRMGDAPDELPPQMDQLAAFLPKGATVDALLLQIGANDVHFSKVAADCARPTLPLPGYSGDLLTCDTPKGEASLTTNLAKLAGLYGDLAGRIRPLVTSPDRVYISEYHDLTRGDDGSPCRGITLNDAILYKFTSAFPPESEEDLLSDEGLRFLRDHLYDVARATALAALHTSGTASNGDISPEEVVFAAEKVIAPLNVAVKSGAANNGWTFVDGLVAAFSAHGYCAAKHWVVHSEESMASQGNIDGTLHPNIEGHQALGSLLFKRLASDLKLNGLTNRQGDAP